MYGGILGGFFGGGVVFWKRKIRQLEWIPSIVLTCIYASDFISVCSASVMSATR